MLKDQAPNSIPNSFLSKRRTWLNQEVILPFLAGKFDDQAPFLRPVHVACTEKLADIFVQHIALYGHVTLNGREQIKEEYWC